MGRRENEIICSFGKRRSRAFRTESLCPASKGFSRINKRAVTFDLASGKRYRDTDFPAVMCGDLSLSKRGVETLQFELPPEPGFYQIDFGFLNLTHQQVVKGDNNKYPVTQMGRMKERNALEYIKYHDEQLDARDPKVVLEWQRINQMDHHPQYARVEILLDGVEVDAFHLSKPTFVKKGGNRFVPEIYTRTIPIVSAGPHTLTVRTVNRWSPPRSGRQMQWASTVTEDLCPTFFSLRKAAAPSSYNAFTTKTPGASEIDLWGWMQVIGYQRTKDEEAIKSGIFDLENPVEVDLDEIERTNTEACKWGSNLIEIYWEIFYKNKGDHVIEWSRDDPLKGADNYNRYERSIWNNKKCRQLTRSCHDLGMLVDWYQGWLPLKKGYSPDAPPWWRGNFMELISREFADVLKEGWRGTVDAYESEAGGNSILFLELYDRLWKYNPGMALAETGNQADRRVVRGLFPGFVLVPCNTYFLVDQFMDEYYPFEKDESEYGVQSLILQSNARAVGIESTRRRCIGEVGGPTVASPDGILLEANDLFRPRFRPKRHFLRPGIWWISTAENLLPVWMRDYVYGLSNDPVRAAVTTELTATGQGGVLDRCTKYWTSWCQARHSKPARTKLLGNNHLRLYRDADKNTGELEAELEGLADFTIHGPKVSIAGNPFKIAPMEGPVELKVTEEVTHRYLEHAGHVAKLEETINIEPPQQNLWVSSGSGRAPS